MRDGTLVEQPFLDITGRIASGGERGLLGIAFHPGYPTDPPLLRRLHRPDGNTVVSSFRVSPGDPDVADPGSEVVLLHVTRPFANHNGGGIAFGPDGKLYIALGDGGSGGDPQGNGQRLDTLLAKILRIDVDATSGDERLRDPARQPVPRDRGRQTRDLADRPAQPVALQLRRPDGRPVDRRRRPGGVGGDRCRPAWCQRPGLRMERHGGLPLLQAERRLRPDGSVAARRRVRPRPRLRGDRGRRRARSAPGSPGRQLPVR